MWQKDKIVNLTVNRPYQYKLMLKEIFLENIESVKLGCKSEAVSPSHLKKDQAAHVFRKYKLTIWFLCSPSMPLSNIEGFLDMIESL